MYRISDGCREQDLDAIHSITGIVPVISLGRVRWVDIWRLWARREMHAAFWCGNLKKRGHLGKSRRRKGVPGTKIDMREIR